MNAIGTRIRFLLVMPVLFLIWSCGSSTSPNLTGSISVSSVPTGAQVFLDGTAKGMVTNCSLTNVAAGNHTVKLALTGYTDYQGSVTVTAGRTATVNATLTPAAAAALTVTPAEGLTSTGPTGGPFNPASQVYTLQNAGGTAFDWTAGATQTWVTVAPLSGNLAPGATTTVTVTINAGANALAAGAYNDTVTFVNAANGSGNTTRLLSLTIADPGALTVTPAGGLLSSGPLGGPFTPASQDYTLQNSSGAALDWTAAATQAWVTVAPLSGTLAPGATTTVTVSINAGANALTAGAYGDTITFTNVTGGTGTTTRPLSLMVNSTLVSVTVDYSRVLPVPNPNGLDFPWVSWTYAGGNGTRGMTKVVDDIFTSPLVPIPTETVITIWVTDLKMDNGITTRVCRTLKINGQLIDVGTTIYGTTTFILGTNGVIRRPL